MSNPENPPVGSSEKTGLKFTTIAGFILAALVIFAAVYLVFRKPPAIEGIGEFAQCLADRNFTMYGAIWCPHCQRQKLLFGDAFAKVRYVECPENTALCKSEGIEGFPTWKGPNGVKLVGEQTISELSDASGCVSGNK